MTTEQCQCGHSEAAHRGPKQDCTFCSCLAFGIEWAPPPVSLGEEPDDVMHALAVLCEHPAFQSLTPVDLRPLAQRGRRRMLMAGTALAERGEESDRLFILLKGHVAVSRPASGMLVELDATLGPGDVVCELSLLHGTPHTATVTALDDVRALEVERGNVQAALQEHDGMRRAFMRLMHDRMEGVFKPHPST